MDSRFTFKDFVFTVLLLAVVGVVVWASFQFNYTEKRVSDLSGQIRRLADTQQQQLVTLNQIRDSLANGVAMAPANTGTNTTGPAGTQASSAPAGVVREKRADGSEYVYYPTAPKSPRDPRNLRDYAVGDWLVENLGSEPAVVAPYIYRDAYGAQLNDIVLEGLLTRNPQTLEWQPFLAKSYEVLPDHVTYRFTLRDNLRFSDNTPITVADVLFSYHTVMDPKIDDDSMRPYFATIKYVKQIGPREIEVQLKEPYFQGLSVAAGPAIIPEHVYKYKTAEEFNKRTDVLVGSGPYTFDQHDWARGQQMVLRRNPNYWGEYPTFDRLVYRFITNQQAALQALLGGQIDDMGPLPDQYLKYAQDGDFLKKFLTYKYKRPNSGYRYIGWNLREPQFTDKLTRQALTQLLDREAINQTIGKGLWYTVTGPFSPLSKQSDPDVKPWPYSMQTAEKKLADAGWKAGADGVLERDGVPFRFKLTIPADIPTYQRIAEYAKAQYQKAGIDMTIEPLQFPVMVDRMDQRQFDAVMLGWTAGIEDDPYQVWDSSQIAGKGSNFIGFDNTEADKLIESGRRELDEAKRMAIWHKFHDLIHEEQPYTFLQSSYVLSFVANRFKNTEPFKIGPDTGVWYVPRAEQKYK